jgi:flavodoxin
MPDDQLGRRALMRAGLAAGLSGFVAGCSTERSKDATTASADDTQSTSGAGSRSRPTADRPLLAYFSRAGENYHYGGRIDLEVGNTAVVAGMIADLVDVDVYEIRPADPYPHDYEATVRRNVREQESDARPAIAGQLPDLERYSTVLLGSGVWNVRAPMIMRTFVESFDFTGRSVLPFVTYAVSGMGRAAEEYAELCVGATIGNGLAVQGEEARQARPDVRSWLRRTGLL